jgi:hypothetical protein
MKHPHILDPRGAVRADLALHRRLCDGACGHLHTLRVAAEAVHGAVAPRFVSSLLVLVALAAGLAWLVS